MRTFSRTGSMACARCQAALLSESDGGIALLGGIIDLHLDVMVGQERSQLRPVDPARLKQLPGPFPPSGSASSPQRDHAGSRAVTGRALPR